MLNCECWYMCMCLNNCELCQQLVITSLYVDEHLTHVLLFNVSFAGVGLERDGLGLGLVAAGTLSCRRT